jgi:hypothetical protein
MTRRLLIACSVLVSLCLASVQVSADVAVVQTKNAGTANPFVTDGIAEISFDSAASTGSLLITCFGVPTAARNVTSVNATGDGALTLMAQGGTNATAEVAGNAEVWCYSRVAGASVTEIVVTLSSAVAADALFFTMEVSGQHGATPIEDVVNASTSTVTTHSSGNITTAAGGSLLVGIAFGTTGAYTNDADFTALDDASGLGVSGYDLVGAGTFTYEVTTSATESVAIAAVAIAPAVTATGHKTLLLRGVGD